MPRLSVWLIRAALLYLLFGFTFGALILIQKGTNLFPTTWRLLPLHIEFLLFGWTLQLIMGTAFWILPRFKLGAPRGSEGLVWAAYALLNTGIGLVCAASLASNTPILLVLGRGAEAVAAGLFAWHALPRLKPQGA